MKLHFTIFAIIIVPYITCNSLFGQEFRTQPLSPDIHTIEVNTNGDKNRSSIMRLNSSEYIQIGFDRLSTQSHNALKYRIMHCDANWNVSKGISEIDYLGGFNDNAINEYSPSLTTTIDYVHFNVQIPNKDIELKISGNYVVEVYENDNPQEVLLNACFSVVDARLNIGYKVTSNTDIDTNKEHQQLSLDIFYPNFNIRDPLSDLKIYVIQNQRLDTQRQLTKPTFVGNNKISYEHNNNLIFEAGNEYRRFELSSYKYTGMNVDRIEFNRPHYVMHLKSDNIKSKKTYRYNQDQNGRFYIRNAESDNNEIESDYFITRFSISMEAPLLENIYLNGDFTYNSFSDTYKMKYDYMLKEYSLSLLLKQGLYNYHYLTPKNSKLSPSQIEGNYHETENEYLVNVYYQPPGQRYDALMGSIIIYSRAK